MAERDDKSRPFWHLNSDGILRWVGAIIVGTFAFSDVKSDGRNTSTRLDFTIQQQKDDKLDLIAKLAEQKADAVKALEEQKIDIEQRMDEHLASQREIIIAQENELTSVRDFIQKQALVMADMKARQEDVQVRVVDIGQALQQMKK